MTMKKLLLAIALLLVSGCAATVYAEPEPAPITVYRPYYAPPVYYAPSPVFIYSRGGHCHGGRCR